MPLRHSVTKANQSTITTNLNSQNSYNLQRKQRYKALIVNSSFLCVLSGFVGTNTFELTSNFFVFENYCKPPGISVSNTKKFHTSRIE